MLKTKQKMNTIKRLSAKSHFKRDNVICFLVMMMLGSLSALATDETSFIHIKFENEETLDSLRTARPDLSFERIVPYSQKYDDRHRKSGLHLWYKVGVKDSLNADNLINELKQNRGIRSIKRPQKIEIPDIENDVRIVTEKNGMLLNSVEKVNDPLYPQQWHYQNAAGVSVNVESAWNIELGSRNVVVAVMDTRVDVEHPDLHDNAWVNEEEFNGLPDVDDDGNGHVLGHEGAVGAVMAAVVGDNDGDAVLACMINQALDAAEGGVERAHVFLAHPALGMTGFVRPAQIDKEKVQAVHGLDGGLGHHLVGLLIAVGFAGIKGGVGHAAGTAQVAQRFPIVEKAAALVLQPLT